MAPLDFYREAGGRCQRLLSSLLSDSVEATGHAGLARGARRVGAPSRGRPASGGAARQGRLPQGAAAACDLLPGLPGRALEAASGCVRLAAARCRPADPLLRRGEGSLGARRRRRWRRAGPQRPVGSGERRQLGTYEGRRSARTQVTGSALCRDTHPVFWEVTGSQGVRSR